MLRGQYAELALTNEKSVVKKKKKRSVAAEVQEDRGELEKKVEAKERDSWGGGNKSSKK